MSKSMMERDNNVCVIVPVYNNYSSIGKVITDIVQLPYHLIVVDDGSDDTTSEIINQFSGNEDITIVSYKPNRGKGYALKAGFIEAQRLGFSYSISFDGDGQHNIGDIERFVEKSARSPEALIVGSRSFTSDQLPENMPSKNTFANKFSNFWFHLQTLKNLPDTQCGFRLYPLKSISKTKFICNRYAFELEVLVRLAWRGIELIPLPILVYYPPEGERVTHFKTRDFVKISILNTFLTLGAFVYGYWSMLIHKIIKS